MRKPNFSKNDPEAGKPVHDRENPDPAKRDQPIVGLTILKDFAYGGNNKWKKGTIYEPDNGKSYKCQITLAICSTSVQGATEPSRNGPPNL